MRLCELRFLVEEACKNGFENVDVYINCEDDHVTSGTPVDGLRLVQDSINGDFEKHVIIIEG